MLDDDGDEDFGFYEGECQGCGSFSSLDDIGLCEDCSRKFERDVIRQRNWEYSALAFGIPENRREELRRQIMKEHGERYELIVPDKELHEGAQQKENKSSS